MELPPSPDMLPFQHLLAFANRSTNLDFKNRFCSNNGILYYFPKTFLKKILTSLLEGWPEKVGSIYNFGKLNVYPPWQFTMNISFHQLSKGSGK